MYIYQFIAILQLSILLYYFTQTKECILLRLYNSAYYASLHRCTFPFPVQSFASHVSPFHVHGRQCAVGGLSSCHIPADGSMHLLHKQLICWFIRTTTGQSGPLLQELSLISPLLRAPIACYVSRLLLPSSSTVPCSVFVVILYLLGLFFYFSKALPLAGSPATVSHYAQVRVKGENIKRILFTLVHKVASRIVALAKVVTTCLPPPPPLPTDFVEECVGVPKQQWSGRRKSAASTGKVSFGKYSRQKKCMHNNRYLQL